MAMRRVGPYQCARAVSSLGIHGFPDLDLVDRLSLLFNIRLTPASPYRVTRRGPGLDIPPVLSSLPRSRGQSCLPGRWRPASGACASICSSQDPLGGPFLIAHLTRVIAPMIDSLRMSRCPILEVAAARQSGYPQGHAGDRGAAPTVRLSADRSAAGAQGHADEPEEAVSALPRGRAVGPAQAGPQAGPWNTHADAPRP